jgi:hypothetical protein
MYLFDNELFAIECMAKYAREGLVVDSRNGQFAHCPTPKPKGQKYKLPGDSGYWLTFNDHQHQGLLQSVDMGRRCFFTQDVKRYLDTKPPGYGELYIIYKHYISGEHSSRFGVPHTEAQKKAQSKRMLGNTLTEETKKRISEEKKGEKNPMFGMSGEKSPRFGARNTEAQKKAHSERMSGENHPFYGRTGALHHNSKAIIVIKPDGTKLHFGSINEAARDLRTDSGKLCWYLNNGKQPKKGKWEGWQFFFVQQKSNKKAGD